MALCKYTAEDIMTGVYTVSQINTYIKNMFVRDFALSNICIAGEVSNCKYHTAGHIYFTLKDEGAAIACVMFASQRAGLQFRLSDGQKVEARGQISVYEKAGTYQLYAKSLRLSGQGELFERFQKLKEELRDMGMFDDMYKKPIPRYTRSIGIVTAPTGAAIRDICNISLRRDPYVRLVLYPALVQGDSAKESIVRGIRELDDMGLDVIIVGRGGGSIEDLWAFNEPEVARAIFDAATPIVSAVGHETDFTIADFVADLRAPTPSAAAELCTFEYDTFEKELSGRRDALTAAMQRQLKFKRNQLETRRLGILRHDPKAELSERRKRLLDARARMGKILDSGLREARARQEAYSFDLYSSISSSLKERRHRISLLSARLDGVSPLKRISGGFGYISDEAGRGIRSVSELNEGEILHTRLRDGSFESRVTSINKEEEDHGKKIRGF